METTARRDAEMEGEMCCLQRWTNIVVGKHKKRARLSFLAIPSSFESVSSNLASFPSRLAPENGSRQSLITLRASHPFLALGGAAHHHSQVFRLSCVGAEVVIFRTQLGGWMGAADGAREPVEVSLVAPGVRKTWLSPPLPPLSQP